MTDYKNELRSVLYDFLGDFKEKRYLSEGNTDEAIAKLEALLSKRELELLRHITVGGRGGMELFVQNVPIKSYKQQVSDRIKLTNREER